MSTILDALRKSEQERKLNKLPTLVDMAAPLEASRWPIYIGVVLVLLASALVLLAYVIWSAGPEVTKAPDNISTIITSDSRQKKGAGSRPAAGFTFAGGSLRVDVVSYSEDAKLRFAMINGKLMREGEFVEPGLRVESIHLKYVVFNARGEKIILGPK